MPRLTRERILVWGTIAVFTFAGFLVALDGYLFYAIVLRGEERVSPSVKSDIVTSQEIDAVIEILDERQKKFEEIFGAPL